MVNDLERALRAQHLECVLAAFFPCGTTLKEVGKMDQAQFSFVVDQSRDALVALLVELGAQLASVGTSQHAVEGGNFAKGGGQMLMKRVPSSESFARAVRPPKELSPQGLPKTPQG